jgi:hypothetical protein
MNCDVELGSNAIIPSLMKFWVKHSKVVRREIHIQTRRQQGDVISLLLFFQNKESRLK